MSEEEKEAVKATQYIIEEVKENEEQGSPTYLLTRDTECLKKIIKLINKQQKQLENEKKYSKKLDIEAQRYFEELIFQDRIIDKMAGSWKQDDIRSKEEIKEYFTRQVKEEE